MGPVHRPRLPIRGRALDLDLRNRSRHVCARGPDRPERGGVRETDGDNFQRISRWLSTADQPFDVAEFPDDPQPALGQGQHGPAR